YTPAVPVNGAVATDTVLAEFGDLAGIMAAVDDPKAKLTPSQRKRLDEARPYVAVAPTVVRVAGDVPLPDVDTVLPKAPRDAARLDALSARWGLGGSLHRLLVTLGG
ncbi:flap endonuclease, partial [Streptomyces sp. NPDC005921]